MSEEARFSAIISQADGIASWCEVQHEKEENMAKQQIQWVLVLVIVGILLLLAMPRLIQEIDYLWDTDSLPTSIVQKARTTQGDIELNQEEMAQEVSAAMSRLSAITAELNEHKRTLEDSEGRLKEDLEKSFTAFRHVVDADRNDRWVVRNTIQVSDRSLMAVGYESSDDEGELLLLLAMRDGGLWTPIRPATNGLRLQGQLHALLEAADGTFVAAGFRSSKDDGETLLLLRSTDGLSWAPIQPTVNGKNVRGRLRALLQAGDGTFVAVGFRMANDDRETLLLLRSTDGMTWSPILPVADGKKLEGRLHAILQGADGTFIAVGFEGVGTRADTLLLRSSDGLSWEPVYPSNDGIRIPGRLYCIFQAEDRTFLGAGFEGKERLTHTPLLLRSSDGVSWRSVPLSRNGEQLRGSLRSIVQAADGAFFVGGEEIWSLSPTTEVGVSGIPVAIAEETELADRLRSFRQKELPPVWWSFHDFRSFSFGSYNVSTSLLLRSEDGASWTALPLYKHGLRLSGPLEDLLLTENSSVIVTSSPYFWLQSLPKEETRKLHQDIAENLRLSADLVVVADYWPLLKDVNENRNKVAVLEKNLRQQNEFVGTAEKSLSRQREARRNMEKIVTELDQALRRVELVREAGQIATRIAIVGLLIYFVQILVNRYRYHRHVAKFYKARAQALRLIIADSSLHSFSNTSLADLAAALSPDGTYFDKPPKPPTAVFTYKQ